MLHTVASYLANLTICKSQQNTMKMPILIYGFEIILSQVFAGCAIIFIGLFTRKQIESVTFLVTFISLRLYCGGYHAETYKKCFLSSIALFILILVLCELTLLTNVFFVLWSIGELASGVILYKAPVININHPVSEERKKINRRKAVLILLSIDIVIILCIVFEIVGNGVITATITKIMVAVLMQLGIWNERRRKE